MSIFIGIITQNEKDNIGELVNVANHFDGLAAVDHFSSDGTYEILNAAKGDGFVEQIPYYSHHAHSMNHFLFNPKIKMGDWILLRDSCERVADNFAQNIRNWIQVFEQNGINSVYQYSKLLMFKRFPQQFFVHTPHWGFQGARPGQIQIDQQNWFKSDLDYCYSVRNDKRDKFHFVNAYLRYYLILDSNHSWLGAENAQKAGITLENRELNRMRFLQYLQSKNIPNNVNTVLDSMKKDLDEQYKWFINNELILNNAYRYNILGLVDFQDNHNHLDKIIV